MTAPTGVSTAARPAPRADRPSSTAPDGEEPPDPPAEAIAADLERGLSTAEAIRRQVSFGPNQLPEPKTRGLLEIFASQFLSPFIYILIVAAIASLAVGQTPSAIFITLVLLLNAVIGATQEASAQRSASALRAMIRGVAHVVRDGAVQAVDIVDIVPGDVVHVASGDRTPADIKLYETRDLAVDESMLTGESVAVNKNADAHAPANASLSERLDHLFAGSIVTHGRGIGIVTATGLKTEIGRIADRVSAPKTAEPPLMIRIRRFTYQVAGAILLAILGLAGLMAARGGYEPTEILMMGIGLAVSTIPEGLPAALTVALAIGMRRMAKANVIIRKLVAVEALGSCTFICSDKTGTLTVNKLTIDQAVLPSGRSYSTTGAGVGPGEVKGEALEQVRDLALTGILANESHLDYAGGEWVSDGDIVDVAFLVFAKKLGLSLTDVKTEHRQLHVVPYESERAFSASVNANEAGPAIYVKGSPERILAASTHMRLDEGEAPIDVARITAQFEDLAARGYRIIALAKRSAAAGTDWANTDALADLTFLGMVAMIDPVRPEARGAIQRCREGGVGVAMVTGDHPATARAIGADLGLCEPDDPVVTGAMIREAHDQGEAAVRALVLPARVFARIEPLQKSLIVDTFMKDGHFVAVTGDGVNDAPAMRKANAGVAMGKSGTDVAKESAELIITDDNFASIVAGIEQGRIVYNNIRKVIGLLTATGFSAIILFFLTVAFGLPMPLTAIQLLWLNLVANGLQDVALAFEPKEGSELKRKPRDPREPIFERHIIEHVLVAGSFMGILAFTVFALSLHLGFSHGEAQNFTLLMMVLFGNVHALSSRSETRSVFTIAYAANRFLAIATPAALGIHLLSMHIPGLRGLLGVSPPPLWVFAALFAVALFFLFAEEIHKATIRWRANQDTADAEGGAS